MSKILFFKQNFFKYINKAEYAIALSSILGTLSTTIIQGYSGYLSDRNARIERINKNPLKRIYIDYISFDEYQRMIDKKNWKPISEKNNMQKIEEKKIEKNKSIIDLLNNFLIEKKKKDLANNAEIDEESLKRLAEINRTALTVHKQQNNSISNSENNKDLDNNIKKKVLPPIYKKTEQIKYFVVQDAGGYNRYNPIQYKKNNIKQNIQIKTKNVKSLGKIGGKDIVKDNSIFRSLYNIWAFFLYKKNPKKYKQIINSKYDQYGNKINNSSSLEDNDSKLKNDINTQNNKINKEEKKLKDSNVNNIIGNIKNENFKNEIKFLVPKLLIDKNINDIYHYNSYIINSKIGEQVNRIDLEMLMYLEYTIETCWYQEYTKKGEKNISSTFTIEYDKNGNLKSINMNYFDELVINNTVKNDFIQNFITIINNCSIKNIKNLNEHNYQLWGKIQIEFK